MHLKDLKHVTSTRQLEDTEILDELYAITDDMERRDSRHDLNRASLRGRLLANVFYEPSTRTRFSFDAAMQKLGGRIIDTESAGHFSSVTKGETLEDTIRIIAGYADVIVLRHNVTGSAMRASSVSDVPVINAGDGTGEHPTQALLDMYTIKRELGRTDNYTLSMIGDLKHGRTIHSLLHLVSLYPNVKVNLASPEELKLPEEYKEYLMIKKIPFEEHFNIESILENSDVLYVTRIQKERFSSLEDYERVKGSYIINKESLWKMKKDAVIMHPLPRVDEISPEVDTDKRAAYFRQAKNGMYVRMALLQSLLKRKNGNENSY